MFEQQYCACFHTGDPDHDTLSIINKIVGLKPLGIYGNYLSSFFVPVSLSSTNSWAKNILTKENPIGQKIGRKEDCGDREDMPLYGILIPSPSYTEEPLGRSGAGVAKHVVRRRDAGAEVELYMELNLILVVFL